MPPGRDLTTSPEVAVGLTAAAGRLLPVVDLAEMLHDRPVWPRCSETRKLTFGATDSSRPLTDHRDPFAIGVAGRRWQLLAAALERCLTSSLFSAHLNRLSLSGLAGFLPAIRSILLTT